MTRAQAALLVGVITAFPAQGPDTSTRAVVAAAAAYIAEYQQQLTSVLADEAYSQSIVSQIPLEAGTPRVRTMKSEGFFMFTPGTRDWMAIRDVMAVDEKPVGDERPDLEEALRTVPARQVATTFKTYNSRFNIGRTYRNFNEPTLSLLVFDKAHRHRFSFDRRRVERADGVTLVTISFVERETPTLIRDLTRGRLFSRGEMVVEAATGRIRRAVLEAKVADARLLLTTTYAPDERLGMWVPTIFREEYDHGLTPSSKDIESRTDYEHIACEATYSNYRRFETSVRIR